MPAGPVRAAQSRVLTWPCIAGTPHDCGRQDCTPAREGTAFTTRSWGLHLAGSIASMAAATAGKCWKWSWAPTHRALSAHFLLAPHTIGTRILLSKHTRGSSSLDSPLSLYISDTASSPRRLRVEPLFAAAIVARHIVFHVSRPAHSPSTESLSTRPPVSRAGGDDCLPAKPAAHGPALQLSLHGG